jgi:hypothetical protein
MSIQNLVQKAVDTHNETATKATETRVQQLVNAIIQNEASIANLQKQNDGHKKALKELELPTPVKVEL